MRIKNTKLGVLGIFLIIFTISVPFWTCYGLVNGATNQETTMSSDYASELEKTVQTNLQPAPDVNSFFEKYDQDFVHTESYLPENYETENSTSTYVDYDENLVGNIDLSKIAYGEGELVEYIVQVTSDFEQASFYPLRIMIIEGDNYYYWYSGYGSYNIISDFFITTDADGFYEGSFLPPASGSYTIVVIPYLMHDYPIARRVVTVAPISAFWRVPYASIREVNTLSYVLVANTSDFSPVSNANVTLYIEDWFGSPIDNNFTRRELYSGVTSSDGLIVLNYTLDELTDSFSCLILEVEYDGTIIDMKNYIWSYYDYNYYSNQKYQLYDFITTLDKPIYMPGDIVKTRTLVLMDNYYDVTKEPVSNSEIEVELYSSSGFTLYHKLLTTDENGIIEWTYHFDDETKLGDYILAFRKGASSEKVIIEISDYVKPDFWVEIELESEYVEPRAYIEGTVIAEYYFGKPVIGTVLVEFLYYDIVMGNLEGTLDSEGKLSFKWRVPRYNPFDDNEIEALVVKATVTDTIDRVVTAEKDVVCSSEMLAYLWTYPWEIFQRGDTINAYFYAYQISVRNNYYWYSWNPVSDADVTITVYGTGIAEKIEKLFVLESKTDIYGSGFLAIDIPEEYYDEYSTYIFEMEVTTDDGRSAYASQSISLAIIETHVELTPSTDINPGDDLTLSISVINMETNQPETASISVYIMDSEYDSIYYTWDYVLSGSESFSISLSDFAPSGRYRINTYCRVLNSHNSLYSPRYSSHHLTFVVGDDYSLAITTDKEQYKSTESIEVSGEFIGDTNVPIVVELAKKGLVDIITFDPSTTDFTLTLNDIKQLGPRLTIFAYAITTTGIVLEAIVIVEIIHDINIQIETDKEIYEPGETAQVTITVTDENNDSIDALSVFSLIDSSIFAVKADDLKEESYFGDEYYWPQLSTRCSWTAPMSFWWYWWMLEDNAYYSPGFYEIAPVEGIEYFGGVDDGLRAQPSFEGEIRDNLPESANWLPNLKITDGEISFDVPLPDNIGEWTIRLFTFADGIGKITKKTFKTFIPFFVDLKIPNSAIQDNVIIVRGIVYNYLDDESLVQLSLEANGLTILNNPEQEVLIPKDYLVEVKWSVYCDDFGDINITLTGIASIGIDNWFDGMRKSLRITPNGVPIETIQSGFINGSEEITFDIFDESIYTDTELIISPGIMETAITSWNRLIGYPYGCIEQTMSKVFPDVMIYHYLNQSGLLTDDIKYQLDNMLQVGLSKIASNQNPDGGWGWWQDDASLNYMTAVVLYGLGLMDDLGFELSPYHLSLGIDFLVDQQLWDGSFTTHYWRLDDLSFTAYALRSLIIHDSLTPIYAIEDAIDYIENTWITTPAARNPYAAALYIEATYDTIYYDSSFVNDLITYILGEAIIEDGGLRWEVSSEYMYRALGGTVETTASVITALTLVDFMSNYVTIRTALSWIMEQQHDWGWGSTADSSAAIKAIIIVAQYTSDPIDCTIDLELNTWNEQVIYNETEDEFLTAELYDLDDYLIIGTNVLNMSQIGTGQIYYYFSVKQILRSDLEIQVEDTISTSVNTIFTVNISLHHDSTIIYPVNILITSLESDMTLVGSTSQSLQILLDDENIEFSYMAPQEPGFYTLAGFDISYQFADETLETVSDGIVKMTIDEITIIVSQSPPSTSSYSMPREFHDNFLNEDAVDDLAITRVYSKISDFQIGEVIDVSLSIANDWEVKEYVMIEYDIPTGFEIVESSLASIDSLVDYSLTQNKLTLFILSLDLGITAIDYKITAMDVGSSISLPVSLSSMYDDWSVESDAHVLGSLSVRIDPFTGLPKIDALKPIFMLKTIKVSEGNRAYDVTIDVLASDNDDVKSVKVLFSDDSGVWQTKDGTYLETMEDDSEKYSIDLGSFEGTDLTFIIAIEDKSGNVFYTESTTIPIPALTMIFGFIVIALLVAFAFASTTAITVKKFRPKTDSSKIIANHEPINHDAFVRR
ncbi:MAG: hypothetical protein FK733_08450 [Asgard group archaeon]|nr:hypothetical protein [Asgard group archaeon]